MAKKKSQTAAPTGLSVSRQGQDIIFKWAQGEGYQEQDMHIVFNGIELPANQLIQPGSTALQYPFAWYGSPINWISFNIRGKAKDKTWSNWSWSGNVYYVYAPQAPSVTQELKTKFCTEFKWTVHHDDIDPYISYGYRWESILAKNGSVNWNGAETSGDVGAFEGSKSFDEGGFGEGDYCYVRHFRIRSNGYLGSSEWKYFKHVYAVPNQPTNVSGSYKELSDGRSQLSVAWNSNVSDLRPVDQISIRYQAAIPTINISESASGVSMSIAPINTDSGWTEHSDVGNRGGNRSFALTIPTHLQNDQCMYVQIVHKHDNTPNYSSAVLLKNGIAKLKTPTFQGEIIPGGEGSERLYTITVNRQTEIENAAIAIHFRTKENQTRDDVIGVIPPKGSTHYTGDTIQLIVPDVILGDNPETPSFGLQAFVGDYSPVSPTSLTEETYYSIQNIKMQSDINWTGGVVPLPPEISLYPIDSSTVQVSWKWSWTEATKAEISWADHDDAWYSTDEPSTYIVNSNNVSRWNVTGLDLTTYYFRVRLLKVVQDVTIYGSYSIMPKITLSSSPQTPSLLMQPNVISKNGTTTGYWAYESTDGTSQMFAAIYEAFYGYTEVANPSGNPIENGYYELIDGNYVRSTDVIVDSQKTYYIPSGEITYSQDPVATTNSTQHITISAQEKGWQAGETHNLALVVTSIAQTPSKYSAPVPVTIADELTMNIVSHSFVDISEDPEVHHWTLTEFPITMTVSGAGSGGTTTYTIERSKNYVIRRPDDKDHNGFEGETVAIKTVDGEGEITFNREDLIGTLDDGAEYRIIAHATDSYGQTAEASLTFEVVWAHQAVIPTATLSKDDEYGVTFITPVKPTTGWTEGDVADIYRLSADSPELIVKDAEFDTKYVDPYPTYGEFGGYRVVYRTKNGDYIDNRVLAMTDYHADDENLNIRHDNFGIVIDFNGDQITLPYNVSLSNSWTKDFIKTTYLGGTIQGDWNPVVERSSTANTVIPIEVEPEQIEALRRLANYPGVCHVRTPDGSSFSADVQVKDDREEKWTHRLSKTSLTITKVDHVNLDGLTYDQWLETQNIESDTP